MVLKRYMCRRCKVCEGVLCVCEPCCVAAAAVWGHLWLSPPAKTDVSFLSPLPQASGKQEEEHVIAKQRQRQLKSFRSICGTFDTGSKLLDVSPVVNISFRYRSPTFSFSNPLLLSDCSWFCPFQLQRPLLSLKVLMWCLSRRWFWEGSWFWWFWHLEVKKKKNMTCDIHSRKKVCAQRWCMCIGCKLTLCHSRVAGWHASSPPTGCTAPPPPSPYLPLLHQRQLSPPLLSADTPHLQTGEVVTSFAQWTFSVLLQSNLFHNRHFQSS